MRHLTFISIFSVCISLISTVSYSVDLDGDGIADVDKSKEIKIISNANKKENKSSKFDKYNSGSPELEMNCFDEYNGKFAKRQKIGNKIVVYAGGVKAGEFKIVESDDANKRYILNIKTLAGVQEQLVDFKNKKIKYSDSYASGEMNCI